jgi:hypothetical protein
VAYARNDADRRWYEYDDARVTPKTAAEVERVEAYLLFYRRKSLARDRERKRVVPSVLPVAGLPDGSSGAAAPAGTVLVSRAWYCRWLTCVDPGPVTNMDLLCKHGSACRTSRTIATRTQRTHWAGLGSMMAVRALAPTCTSLPLQWSSGWWRGRRWIWASWRWRYRRRCTPSGVRALAPMASRPRRAFSPAPCVRCVVTAPAPPLRPACASCTFSLAAGAVHPCPRRRNVRWRSGGSASRTTWRGWTRPRSPTGSTGT